MYLSFVVFNCSGIVLFLLFFPLSPLTLTHIHINKSTHSDLCSHSLVCFPFTPTRALLQICKLQSVCGRSNERSDRDSFHVTATVARCVSGDVWLAAVHPSLTDCYYSTLLIAYRFCTTSLGISNLGSQIASPHLLCTGLTDFMLEKKASSQLQEPCDLCGNIT